MVEQSQPLARRARSFSPMRRPVSAAWLAKTKGVVAGSSISDTPQPRSLPAPKVSTNGAPLSSRKAAMKRTFSLGHVSARKPGKAKRATGKAPDMAPGVDEESVQAATKLQSLMRGRMARRVSVESVQAATKLQSSTRGRMARRVAGRASMGHRAAERARAVRAEAKASVNERVTHARFALLEKTVHHLIDGMLREQVETNPWMMPQEIEWTKQLYKDLSKDISRRMEQDHLESVGRGSHELRRATDALVDPTTWPPPPRLWPQPCTYARARFLYAIWSADKNLTYYFNVAPWMLWVNAMLVCRHGQGALLAAPWLGTTGSSECVRRLGAALHTREKRPGVSNLTGRPWPWSHAVPTSPISPRLTIQATRPSARARSNGPAWELCSSPLKPPRRVIPAPWLLSMLRRSHGAKRRALGGRGWGAAARPLPRRPFGTLNIQVRRVRGEGLRGEDLPGRLRRRRRRGGCAGRPDHLRRLARARRAGERQLAGPGRVLPGLDREGHGRRPPRPEDGRHH